MGVLAADLAESRNLRATLGSPYLSETDVTPATELALGTLVVFLAFPGPARTLQDHSQKHTQAPGEIPATETITFKLDPDRPTGVVFTPVGEDGKYLTVEKNGRQVPVQFSDASCSALTGQKLNS
jgi:hypothetical protein